MSRIVVKNIPKQVTVDRFKKLFSEKGRLTDVQFKYTSNGKFRGIAFVGFQTEEEATAAKDYFNLTFIDTSKIKVEICASLHDANKPRAWSKYSKESSSYQKNQEKNKETQEKLHTAVDKNKKNESENEGKEIDPELAEFLKLHESSKQKVSWDNDVIIDSTKGDVPKPDDKPISDLDYLKSKVSKDPSAFNEDNEDDTHHKAGDEEVTVILQGLPKHCKQKEIMKFLAPCTVTNIEHFPQEKSTYVSLNKTDLEYALQKNNNYIGKNKVTVIERRDMEYGNKWQRLTEELEKSTESIAESGRIFVRNLSYSVTEEDLESLFSEFGALTEVNLPIDRFSRIKKGFATITFMMPEHASKAYAELDGTIFHGRMLHLLPAKPKKEPTVSETSNSYKQMKDTKQKATSQSSHNWNALFLGANAVADVVSEKYNVSKDQLLSAEGSHSVAVRMALGETQIVTETRDFLTDNWVILDAFSQPAGPRSKTIIMVKNLPAQTAEDEVKEVFEKYGQLGRVVMPPRGITALVEFTDPSEARKAFKNLAYTRFRHVPLYLEWAPVQVFDPEHVAKKPAPSPVKDEEEEEEDDPNCTLFVKNFSLDVTEEELQNHFARCGTIKAVTIAKKLDIMQPGKLVSMGYGFVHFKKNRHVQKAMKELQNSKLGGRNLELKVSERMTKEEAHSAPRRTVNTKLAPSTKIMVRNVPFEATLKELEELFGTFGELKSVRMPKKADAEGSGSRHRGFAFVDFLTKPDAKRAFAALCQSTHLYGRRMVLEWANKDESVGELREKTRKRFLQDAPVQSKFRKANANLFFEDRHGDDVEDL